jgi:hypothetical protein
MRQSASTGTAAQDRDGRHLGHIRHLCAGAKTQVTDRPSPPTSGPDAQQLRCSACASAWLRVRERLASLQQLLGFQPESYSHGIRFKHDTRAAFGTVSITSCVGDESSMTNRRSGLHSRLPGYSFTWPRGPGNNSTQPAVLQTDLRP